MANVKFIRAELCTVQPIYALIGDALSGQPVVKARRTIYLPKPNPEDTSAANSARYDSYLLRAVFYNVTRRTLSGLCGQVFSRDPDIAVPDVMLPVIADADGSGVSLNQLAKKTLRRTIAFGRAGLLTDFPTMSGAVTRAQVQSGEIRPVILGYDPWNIINWRTRVKNSLEVLSLIVLRETYSDSDDGFEVTVRKQFRVLKLDDDGLYVMEIHRFKDQDTELDIVPGSQTVITKVGGVTQGVTTTAPALQQPQSDKKATDGSFQSFEPTSGNGERLDHLPFTFVGSENNDSEIDDPPMSDMASLNIAHYRNSADYEEAVYIMGQPTPVVTGLTQDWVTDVLKGTLTLGSRAVIPLPVGATAFLLQAAENTMPIEAMKHKEKQMVAIGAQLIEPGEVEKTAKQSSLEHASETSVVVSSANNVAEAMAFSLREAAAFLDLNVDDIKFVFSTDFAFADMSPEQRRQLLDEWVAGVIAFPEIRASLRKSGITSIKNDDEAKKMIDAEMKERQEAAAKVAQATQVGNNNNPSE